MSYAVRKDGKGWRAVSGPANVTAEETFQENYPGEVVPSAADQIKLQIASLEAQQTPRRIREAALGLDGGWLQGLEAQIVALRSQL